MGELWCTLGPSSLGKEYDLLAAGATGFRFTFSFATPEVHHKRAADARRAAEALGSPCVNVADLPGGKYRLGSLSSPSLMTHAGDRFTLYAHEDSIDGDPHKLPVRSRRFFSQLRTGARIIVGDGACILKVLTASSCEALAQVEADGTIDQNRGLAIEQLGQPDPLTDIDWTCIREIVDTSWYDVVAISFVRCRDDVLRVRSAMSGNASRIKILAKIETEEGLRNLPSICDVADLVMAARGDLMLSLPWVELPRAVEEIASSARAASKPWYLATQIAEGLERFALPTRAEVCDLANWMRQGCAGVLLSYETAFGSRPLEAVRCTRALLNRWAV